MCLHKPLDKRYKLYYDDNGMGNDTPRHGETWTRSCLKASRLLGDPGHRGATGEFYQSQRLERLVEWIESRGLCTPAILFLEASKPLAPIGSQLLLLAQPLIGPAMSWLGRGDGDQALADCADLLESPDSLDRLLARLERAERLDTE